jgi:hypothetical protein
MITGTTSKSKTRRLGPPGDLVSWIQVAYFTSLCQHWRRIGGWRVKSPTSLLVVFHI